MRQNTTGLNNTPYLPIAEQQAFPAYPWPYYFIPAHLSGMRWDPSYYPAGQPAIPTPPVAPAASRNQEDYWDRQQPLTFVLIHGSWADSSFWNGIANELRKKGHTVYTPEYPGHGADPNKDVSHAMITKSIADYIISKNLSNVILLGHSFGGTLVQKVAELVPDRLKRLVFLNAFVLKDGESLGDEFPAPFRETIISLVQSSKDNTIMLPFPLYRDAFVNLASLELAQQMYSEISPEPAKPLLEKLDLKKFYTLTIPKSYIYLTVDNALPQGGGYGWHPHMSSRLGLFRLIKGNGDHMSTAKTEPKMLAQKIYEASRD
ncbi:alpha/beta fold hydrolase [Paenibacillus radicis (ex Xue et al. 2023)]|uniref:Alpha/beta hydrolase n=1 Tax=Paenibacillus radicis (ex Xue et al. 2023) TaxID=2972489 RepID=A0ABT1YIR9_9BACL|nr:alpha/beta hydrolase [Paenibacillus radicis (ex Xue et al. 2023)]MCR8633086.1 alpha/beta hydrolase [Paenibacillus radicis (ex Xue et al. 2023)]